MREMMAAFSMTQGSPFHTIPARAALKAAYSVMILACWIIVSCTTPRIRKTIRGMTMADSTRACPPSEAGPLDR